MRLERVIAVIRGYFEPEARFGSVEIWRRKPVDRGTVSGAAPPHHDPGGAGATSDTGGGRAAGGTRYRPSQWKAQGRLSRK